MLNVIIIVAYYDTIPFFALRRRKGWSCQDDVTIDSISKWTGPVQRQTITKRKRSIEICRYTVEFVLFLSSDGPLSRFRNNANTWLL